MVSYVKETGEANYSQEVIAQIEQSVQEKENKGSKGTSAAPIRKAVTRTSCCPPLWMWCWKRDKPLCLCCSDG